MGTIVRAALRRGVTGALAGSAAGFVMGAVASAVNSFFNAAPAPLTYNYKGDNKSLQNLDTVDDASVEEDIRAIEQYKRHDEASFDTAIRAVQHFIKFRLNFYKDIDAGGDGVAHIARMCKAAKKADVHFRKLLHALTDVQFRAAADDVEKASMNLHLTFEHYIATARDETTLAMGTVS